MCRGLRLTMDYTIVHHNYITITVILSRFSSSVCLRRQQASMFAAKNATGGPCSRCMSSVRGRRLLGRPTVFRCWRRSSEMTGSSMRRRPRVTSCCRNLVFVTWRFGSAKPKKPSQTLQDLHVYQQSQRGAYWRLGVPIIHSLRD